MARIDLTEREWAIIQPLLPTNTRWGPELQSLISLDNIELASVLWVNSGQISLRG